MDKTTFQLLGATAELMGVQLTAPALELMADDLNGYEDSALRIAFSRLRKDGARFIPAEIVKRIPGMWPGAEEAWAQFPRHESDSACVCQEMLTAWGVASELDEISGRMAFKETYNRLVSVSMAEGRMPQWSMTLGHDPGLREQATLDAVHAGKLGVEDAAIHLPHIPRADLCALAEQQISSHRLIERHAPRHTSVDQLLLESPDITDAESARLKLGELLSMLGSPSIEDTIARNQADMDFRKKLYGA